MRSEICKAIENMRLLEFYYEGGIRIVEPHCYGFTTAGNEGLRAYQVDGFSSSGNMGWKMFSMAKSNSISILEKTFQSPRSGYKMGDKGMSEIICEI